MREARSPVEVTDIGVLGEDIAPFLYRLKADRPKHFDSVRRTLRTLIPSKGFLSAAPDLIVIASDSNCSAYSSAFKALETAAGPTLKNISVIACPDPHIERWYMADPPSFTSVVGLQPRLGKKKCNRDRYKAILSKAISDAGYPATLGGAEFAPELVAQMDLYRAGRSERSLKHFVDALRAAFRALS